MNHISGNANDTKANVILLSVKDEENGYELLIDYFGEYARIVKKSKLKLDDIESLEELAMLGFEINSLRKQQKTITNKGSKEALDLAAQINKMSDRKEKLDKITNNLKLEEENIEYEVEYPMGEDLMKASYGFVKKSNQSESEDLKDIIYGQLKASKTYLKYTIHFKSLNFSGKNLIFEDKKIEIYSFPMRHSIEVCGFLIQEKTHPRKINRTAIDAFEVPTYQINSIKEGANFSTDDGREVLNSKLTFEPNPSFSYGYCSDTSYYPELCHSIKKCTVLYHEATFGNELENLYSFRNSHLTSIFDVEFVNLAFYLCCK